MSSEAAGSAIGQVVVFGSLNADLTVRVQRFPQPGETLNGSELVTATGGKGSNQAVAAAVLGSQVRLIGKVGADPHGSFLLDRARSAGVDVAGVGRVRGHATGSAMIVVDATGENTIIVSPGANGTHTADSVRAEHFSACAVVCLCLEVPLPAVQAAARHARRAGALVLLNLSPYAQVPQEILDLTDVLLVNRAEAALVMGDDAVSIDDSGDDWTRAAERLICTGMDRAVITLGSTGAVVFDATASGRERVTVIPAPSVEAIDTTGCGDAFTGALAHGLADGSSLAQAATLAARAGALAATKNGAQNSYRAFAHLKRSRV